MNIRKLRQYWRNLDEQTILKFFIGDIILAIILLTIILIRRLYGYC